MCVYDWCNLHFSRMNCHLKSFSVHSDISFIMVSYFAIVFFFSQNKTKTNTNKRNISNITGREESMWRTSLVLNSTILQIVAGWGSWRLSSQLLDVVLFCLVIQIGIKDACVKFHYHSLDAIKLLFQKQLSCSLQLDSIYFMLQSQWWSSNGPITFFVVVVEWWWHVALDVAWSRQVLQLDERHADTVSSLEESSFP